MNFEYSAQQVASSAVSNNRHTPGGELGSNTTNSTTVPTSSAVGSGQGVPTSARRQLMSRAAVTHRFRKLKTPSKCRECDSYVYFQGKFDSKETLSL